MTGSPTSHRHAAHAACTFVPPYLLRHVATEEHPTVSAAEHPCGQTLRLDQQFRARREQAATETTVGAATTAAEGADRWVIHSANNTETLPGTVVRTEGDPATEDVAVDEAYVWTEQVWSLYAQQFQRESFDGAGAPVVVTVHFGQDYDNAFWDGEQLVFGDGDGQIFERFTKPADVLAHEFSHGVVQYTSGFVYRDQPGALNESIADVFAAMSVQHAAGQTADQATWLIGEGLFAAGIQARALRDMLHPGTAYDDERLGKDPQVGSMADYVETSEDNGGVHLNSGIPNRAFALAATSVGGHSWEQTGRAWYGALTSPSVDSTTDFVGFAEATVTAATELFPDTEVSTKIRGAWAEVGVLPAAAPADVVTPGPPSDASPPLDGPDSSESQQGEPRHGEPESPYEGDGSGRAASAQKVAVRRSGGFTGQVRSAELELDDDPRAEEVRSLLGRVDLTQLSGGQVMPDRFVYTVEIGEQSVTIGEQDLSPDLQRVVQIVLNSSPRLGGGGRDLS